MTGSTRSPLRVATVASLLALALALTLADPPAPAEAEQPDPGPPEAGDPEQEQEILERRELDRPEGVPDPVDPESWKLPEWMTWDDYTPIPGFDWTDPDTSAEITFNGAIVLGDFADRDFLVTQPTGSDVFGMPRADGSNVPRDEVAEWYRDYLMEPQEVNGFHTIDEFWREDSYGRIGLEFDAYGPYRLEGKEHEYGLDEWGAQESCPEGDTCDRDYMGEAYDAFVDNEGLTTAESYDFVFFINPGYDESSTWQEFGEMIFQTEDDVTDAFGPPDPDLPNAAPTRYVDWTSWYSAKGLWSRADLVNSRSLQSESSAHGTYSHEFSHILGVLDNYNNPFGDPLRRSYTGPWANLSRGIFNGPGGPHRRWVIPANEGGHMGSHHMLRNKLRMGLMDPDELLAIERDALAGTGPIVTDVWARSVPLGTNGREGIRGIQIPMAGGDQGGDCDTSEDHRCDGGGYQNYTVEVVDRMGFDSFAHDHGTLIAKTKNVDLPPFMWAIDAHDEDMELVDFYRPDGTPAMMSGGDYRQLANALFKAGSGPGTEFEYVDEANSLHFYVLDKIRDDEGVLRYRIGVRHTGSGGPFPRDVAVGEPAGEAVTPGQVAKCTVDVSSGNGDDEEEGGDEAAAAAAAQQGAQRAADLDPGLTDKGLIGERADEIEALRAGAQQPDPSEFTGRDIVRLAAEAPDGWQTTMAHEVIDLGSGERREVEVYAWRDDPAFSETDLSVTVRATSETDTEATDDATCEVTVPAASPAGVDDGVFCPRSETPDAGFTDIAGNTHEHEIHCLAWHEVTRGRTPTSYAPAGDVTREQMASFIARSLRQAGVDLPEPSDQGFTDLTGGPHDDAINQLAELGLTEGRTPTEFVPRAPVRRDQMASFIVRGYEHVDGELPPGSSSFTDIAGNTHEPAIEKAAEQGFTRGRTPTTYEPASSVRRDQMASFLTRVLERLATEGHVDPRA